MASPTGSTGFWRSARKLPARTPLRVKLIAAVLALVTAALAVISIAGIAFLRGYLLHQADQELRAAAYNANAGSIISSYLYIGSGTPQYGGLSIQWLPADGKLQQVVAEVSGFRGGQPYLPPGPAVRRSDGWLYKPGSANAHRHSWISTRGAQFSAPVSAPVTVHASSGDGRWRVVSSAATFPGPSGHKVKGSIILGIDVTTPYRTIGELTVIDLIVSGVLLVVLAIFGIAVIRSSMRPLTDIERTAEAIAAGDLGRRVPERDPRTEVGKLGRSLNVMLAQIESAFRARTASEESARRSEEAARWSALAASRSEDRLRQFVADASHELRTPLTAIRGYAEYYRQRGGVGDNPPGDKPPADSPPADKPPTDSPPADSPPADSPPAENQTAGSQAADPTASFDPGRPTGPLTRPDLDHLIERVESEAARMGVLVDDMLLLARLDQQRQLDFRTVDLLAIAADALHDARVIAPRRAINLTVGTPEAPLVTGDEVGLRQVVGNLMSNAMTHTPDGTPIDITIRSGSLGNGHRPPDGAAQPPATGVGPGTDGEPAIILEVADHGAGLTDEQKERVFERFYRADRARTRTAGGTGLGLAIVAAMVSAHHGRVWVDSQAGQGATFGFALPLAPEARAATS